MFDIKYTNKYLFLFLGLTHLTPVTEAFPTALTPPIPTATATSVPQPPLLRLLRGHITIPAPSRRQITARTATTASITAGSPHPAAAAPEEKGSARIHRGAPREKAQSGVYILTSAGSRTTKSGVTSILTATSTTFSNCHLRSWHLLHSNTGQAITLRDIHPHPATAAPLLHSRLLKAAQHLHRCPAIAVPRPPHPSATATRPQQSRPVRARGHPKSHQKFLSTETWRRL